MKVVLHLAIVFTIRPLPQNCISQTLVSQYSFNLQLEHVTVF